MSFLKMTVIGNLGQDAVIREVGNNRVISFSVAHSEKYRDRNSDTMIEKTLWVNCSYWRDPDKLQIAQYLKKGTQVFIEGTPSIRTYVNQQGETLPSLECRVLTVQLLGTNPNSGGNASQQSSGGNYNSGPTQAAQQPPNTQTGQSAPTQSQRNDSSGQSSQSSSDSGSSADDFAVDDLPF